MMSEKGGTTDPLQTGSVSYTRHVLSRIWQHRQGATGLVLIGVFFMIALLADFLAPYRADDGLIGRKSQPPSQVHFIKAGSWLPWPRVYATAVFADWPSSDRYMVLAPENLAEMSRINPNAIPPQLEYDVEFFPNGTEYSLFGSGLTGNLRLFGLKAPDQPPIQGAEYTQPPERLFLLGSDAAGRDLLSRTLIGCRTTLYVALATAMISLLIAILLLGCARVAKEIAIQMKFLHLFRNTGMWLMDTLMETWLLLPALYSALAISPVLPDSTRGILSYSWIRVVICLLPVGTVLFMHHLLGILSGLRRKEYFLASMALGETPVHRFLRHTLPHLLSKGTAVFLLSVPWFIFGETALSFLGLGIASRDVSIGTILHEINIPNGLAVSPWALFAGLPLFLLVLGFRLIGDGLRLAVDPEHLTTQYRMGIVDE